MAQLDDALLYKSEGRGLDSRCCHWNFPSTILPDLRKKLVKCYIWSMALYGAETWTLRAADQKYLESFEM